MFNVPYAISSKIPATLIISHNFKRSSSKIIYFWLFFTCFILKTTTTFKLCLPFPHEGTDSLTNFEAKVFMRVQYSLLSTLQLSNLRNVCQHHRTEILVMSTPSLCLSKNFNLFYQSLRIFSHREGQALKLFLILP